MTTRKRSVDNHAETRIVLRVVGLALVAVGLFFLISGAIDFFESFGRAASSDLFDDRELPEGPTRFWMCFVGIPLLGIGAWCLNAGFLGAASRYVADETQEAVRTTASAVGDGLRGRGPYCRDCGTANDANARFCDNCGTSLTR
ncbi:zinc-ribbon domain-containing protein [Actinokineospora xionganensis]|uniref:Zinc ribbon domain-containing protein n=1 Tax=Actinokineospora xionganensis TaxID=2684470 RepID=A0ABR7LEY5_9PSEU|nr:zinc ribbon domain-containing protein [Actinokineospora xionganensis]MBC6450862.1 zinc ribbon domain-containing protein [Actinokineospora xionganensis]